MKNKNKISFFLLKVEYKNFPVGSQYWKIGKKVTRRIMKPKIKGHQS